MAAISVQEDGGGDYTTLEAAVENASTGDGDVITITETWTSSENTQIAVTDALTIQATGASKHIGRPHNGSETTFRHRNSSSGHSFTITDTGSVTFIGLDIQNASTGTSDEVFRNNVANTFLAQNCVLGFASRTSEQDVFYTETTTNATFEQCHFYNVFRGCLDLTGSASGTVNINSCTAYDIGFSDSQTSRSGLVGKNTSGTMTVNIYNTIVHMNEVGFPVCTNSTAANTTANIERLITNSSQAPMDNAPATANYANNVVTAIIDDADTLGHYILLDTTTSPYDLRLFDNDTNNAAQDNHSTATGANLTIPSTDIVGTSRPQNTDFDIGAFEVVAATGDFTLTADSGAYSYTGTAAALTADRILTADSGAYTYTGTAADLLKGVNLTADSGTYTYSGTDAALLVDRVLQADSGTYSYTGTNVDLQRGLLLDAAAGAYTYTGTDATLTFASAGNFILTADSGAYTYTGTNVELTSDRLLIANSGTYVYTGTAADLTSGFILQADSGSYAYTGTTIDFVQQRVLDALTGTYVYNGTNANIFFTPVAPDVPVAKGINSSGAFGGGISVSATFGSGIGSKGSL